MPAKRALLIGIDAYEKIKKLEGCVNDVDLMEKILLENFGFPRANLRVLRNDEATREGILAAFDAFVESVGQDDQVVLHYAGHGSQMTDREGDEPSGYDSTIMPVDSEGWQGDNRDITDDEIHLRLLEPIGQMTSFTTFLFDCCHSGTITRDDFGANSRSMPPDRRPIAELPPSPIPELKRTGARESGPSGWMPLADKYVLISGCRDEELSYEYRPPEGDGKVTHGALTYFLGRELSQATSGTTYRDIFERAAANVTAANDRQHPQMEGRADREIFGIRDIEPMRFVRILERKGDSITLSAGAALGVTVGSTYTVHPQGTKNTEAGEPLGEVEVTAVRGVTADARIMPGAKQPDAIVAGCRAFESVHSYGELRLRVQVEAAREHDAEAAALRAAVEGSPLLALAAAGEAAAVRVYLIAPRDSAGEGDPVPQIGAVKAPTWAGVKEDGQLTMPPKPLGREADVVRNLETLVRYRQALALDNPDADSKLRGKFDLVFLRKAADGQWVPAHPDAESGQVIYEEGEAIAFRVISHQDRETTENSPYVSLLDFGIDGAVSLIYPAPGAREKMLPGGVFEIGTQGDEFELWFPENFPPVADPERGGVTAATETVKLFVTSGEADFGFLEQAGMRSAVRGGDSPLMMLFETAMSGSATRNIRKKPVKQDDWTTVVKPFVLRKKSSEALKADGKPLSIGGTVLTTPGLEGRVEAHAWNSDRAAAAELRTGDLGAALDEAGIDVRQTIEISEAREVGPPTRSARGAPAMELSIRDPGPDHGQMVMTTDELGVVSWHFAPQAEEAPGGSRGAPPGLARKYVIPRTVPSAAPAGPGQRGLVGAVGRKFLKELVFPLVDPVLGAVSESFAGRWEAKNRPYRIRGFSPDDYNVADAPVIDSEGWSRLGGGRALLMVHGTFSRAHTAFGGMPKDYVESLHRRYDGRVFALDHFTLSHDPKQNVSWLFEQLPSGLSLDIDIVCHSRGGLVSRMLTEKLGELNVGSSELKVGKVVFVGSPNAGTVLANADHVGDLIDTWTNLLNFIPDGGVSDVLSGIVTVAKQLAVGVAGGLKGLQSMRPGGDFAVWLNTGGRVGDTRYFALTSDYTPGEPGLREFAKNRLMDIIFKGPNDLVVPTEGVFAENGSGFFPIEDKLVFSGTDAVAHTAFFGKRAARDRIMEWLTA